MFLARKGAFMPYNFGALKLALFLALLLVTSGVSGSLKAEENSKSKDLRETALRELSPSAATEEKAEALQSPSFIKVKSPELVQDEGSKSWSVGIGIESLRPQGQLEIQGLSNIILEELEAKPALLTHLNWNFLKGDKVASALAAELSWSQHRYQITLPSNSSLQNTQLNLFRASLSNQWLYSLNDWVQITDLDLSLGLQASFGRVFQIQSSSSTSLLNKSLNYYFWQWGPALEAELVDSFLFRAALTRRLPTERESFQRSWNALFSVGFYL